MSKNKKIYLAAATARWLFHAKYLMGCDFRNTPPDFIQQQTNHAEASKRAKGTASGVDAIIVNGDPESH